MGLFTNADSIAIKLAYLVNKQQQTFNYLVVILQEQVNYIYLANQPTATADQIAANAQAYVAAMGTNAVAIFNNCAYLVQMLNEIAANTGLPEIPNPMPSYLTFVPNTDGSGSLTYTPPASSSSSSQSSSTAVPSSSSSSSSLNAAQPSSSSSSS